MTKIFIIGLPRSGTTSISVALLGYGFKVAHTAYTKRAFELADVISDVPCFCDYQELDNLFPDSKFVYLERNLDSWIPSIQMLLKKMQPQLDQKNGYLHPVLKRCFNSTFSLSNTTNPFDSMHLETCYLNHKNAVLNYFMCRTNFLRINLSNEESLGNLLKFLGFNAETSGTFPRVNVGRQVDHWQKIKHPNKINALVSGIEHRRFFDYHYKSEFINGSSKT